MPASEREAQPRSPQSPRTSPSVVSMRDLLASCAAATAVSTPPREPETGRQARPEPKLEQGRAAA
ncbi:hypothetical protein [Streptomyces sp. SYSU K21746]